MTNAKNSDWYTMMVISLPILFQSLLFSSRNLVDIFMLGGMGDIEVAAIGAACRYLTLSTAIMFTVAKSSSQKMSRRFGEGEFTKLKTELINLISLILPVSLMFSVIFLLFPEFLIGISTSNLSVVALGADYLQVVAYQLPLTAVVIAISIAMRVVHKPQISTNFSIINVTLNVLLTYVLVSDFLIPSMGIFGAAVATLFSTIVEFVCAVVFLYLKKNSFVFCFKLREFTKVFNLSRTMSLARFSLPMAVSGFLYSFAVFVYISVFGQIGEVEQAAISVMLTLESIFVGLAIGFSQGSVIMIGNAIGQSDHARVRKLIVVTLALTFLSSGISALLIWIIKDFILIFFTGMSIEAISLTQSMMSITVFSIFLKSLSFSIYNGVLRAGGDNKFCLKVDLISIWFLSIPTIIYLSGHISPIELFMFLYLEDALKILIGSYRLKGDMWIKQI